MDSSYLAQQMSCHKLECQILNRLIHPFVADGSVKLKPELII